MSREVSDTTLIFRPDQTALLFFVTFFNLVHTFQFVAVVLGRRTSSSRYSAHFRGVLLPWLVGRSLQPSARTLRWALVSVSIAK